MARYSPPRKVDTHEKCIYLSNKGLLGVFNVQSICEFLHSFRVGAVVRSVNGNFPCYLSAQRLSLSKTTRTAAKLFLGGNYNFCKLVIDY